MLEKNLIMFYRCVMSQQNTYGGEATPHGSATSFKLSMRNITLRKSKKNMLGIKSFLTTATVRFRNSFPRVATWPRNCSYIRAVYPTPSTAIKGPPQPPKLVAEDVPHLPAHFSPLTPKGTVAMGLA